MARTKTSTTGKTSTRRTNTKSTVAKTTSTCSPITKTTKSKRTTGASARKITTSKTKTTKRMRVMKSTTLPLETSSTKRTKPTSAKSMTKTKTATTRARKTKSSSSTSVALPIRTNVAEISFINTKVSKALQYKARYVGSDTIEMSVNLTDNLTGNPVKATFALSDVVKTLKTNYNIGVLEFYHGVYSFQFDRREFEQFLSQIKGE